MLRWPDRPIIPRSVTVYFPSLVVLKEVRKSWLAGGVLVSDFYEIYFLVTESKVKVGNEIN